MTDPRSLTGVVLAGGTGRRMGRDKARIEIGGEPLLLRIVHRLAEVCQPVLVASGDGQRLADLGHPEVADALPDRGPLGGIVAGLEAATTELVAVVAVDMPQASPDVLRLLADRWSGEDAVIPTDADGWQPLHGVYAVDAAVPLRAALERGSPSVRDALARLQVRLAGPDVWGHVDPGGRFLTNLNDPHDLAGLPPG